MAKLLCGRRTDTPCPSGPEPRRFWLFVLSWNILLLKVLAVQDPIPDRRFHASSGASASELRRHRRRGGVAASVSLRLTPGAFSKREYSTVRPCCPPNIFCIILLQPVSMRERSRRGRNSGRKLMPDSEWVRKKAARGSAVFLRGTGCFTMLSIRALPAGRGGAERNFTGFAVLSGTPFPMKRKSSSHNGIFDEYDQNR